MAVEHHIHAILLEQGNQVVLHILVAAVRARAVWRAVERGHDPAAVGVLQVVFQPVVLRAARCKVLFGVQHDDMDVAPVVGVVAFFIARRRVFGQIIDAGVGVIAAGG